jgi:ribosomal silencing factor RsfS
MAINNNQKQTQENSDQENDIVANIHKTISEMTDEIIWPEGAEAREVQSIITQLARSAAQLREKRLEEKKQKLNNHSR